MPERKRFFSVDPFPEVSCDLLECGHKSQHNFTTRKWWKQCAECVSVINSQFNVKANSPIYIIHWGFTYLGLKGKHVSYYKLWKFWFYQGWKTIMTILTKTKHNASKRISSFNKRTPLWRQASSLLTKNVWAYTSNHFYIPPCALHSQPPSEVGAWWPCRLVSQPQNLTIRTL